ncbi:MerR family transcriptional regulator, partial [Salmonella enterica subsp. enterica serovar Typhimurium var. 5-]
EAAMRELQTKIDERQAYLQALDSQLSELRQLA